MYPPKVGKEIMRAISGDEVEIKEMTEWRGKAKLIVKGVWLGGCEGYVYLTADELAEHARECLAVAESMREGK